VKNDDHEWMMFCLTFFWSFRTGKELSVFAFRREIGVASTKLTNTPRIELMLSHLPGLGKMFDQVHETNKTQ
jgi:hypothetical protein